MLRLSKGTGHGPVALACSQLQRSLSMSMWKPSDGMLNQLPGVGSKTTAKLISAGVVSFTDVMCTELHILESAAGRKPPFGDDLKVSAREPESDDL